MGYGSSYAARPQDGTRHESGEVKAWGGIVSAHLSDWAKKFGCTPEVVLRGIDEAGVDVLVDTAEEKGETNSAKDRPTTADRRCIALTTEAATQLKRWIESYDGGESSVSDAATERR